MTIDSRRLRETVCSEVLYHNEWYSRSKVSDREGDVSETAGCRPPSRRIKESWALYQTVLRMPRRVDFSLVDKAWSYTSAPSRNSRY